MDADLTDVESLTFCPFCKQKFNGSDLCPKILQCKHYFCLKCIETTMVKGRELFCVNCWKRMEVDEDGVRNLPTKTALLALANHLTTLMLNNDTDKLGNNGCTVHRQTITLWCHTCHLPLCRLCYLLIEHAGHHVTSHNDAKDILYAEVQTELASVQKLLQDIQRLSSHQREFQLKILESLTTLKACLESEIALGCGFDIAEAKDLFLRARSGLLPLSAAAELQASFTAVLNEKQKLEMRYQELLLQCKLEEIISSSGVIFDFSTLATLHQTNELAIGQNLAFNSASSSSVLLLANYCIYQLFNRCMGQNKPLSPTTIIRNPSINHPHYYFSIELNQVPIGRFVIETRPDLAPKMARNFGALCLGETGPSYKHCSVFQCWEGESIITGDYETNNGRGGRSIYEDGYFMPDETKMAAVRGAVGMRRTQKRHDNLGLVGSQFRVILQEMRGFTAIFGHVIEGIEIVEKIASCGDQTGKPTKSIIITSCGKL